MERAKIFAELDAIKDRLEVIGWELKCDPEADKHAERERLKALDETKLRAAYEKAYAEREDSPRAQWMWQVTVEMFTARRAGLGSTHDTLTNELSKNRPQVQLDTIQWLEAQVAGRKSLGTSQRMWGHFPGGEGFTSTRDRVEWHNAATTRAEQALGRALGLDYVPGDLVAECKEIINQLNAADLKANFATDRVPKSREAVVNVPGGLTKAAMEASMEVCLE